MSDVTYATRGVTFENFDPNVQFASKPLWGMFDGFKFKTYSQRGHAINSVHHHNQAKLYEQTPGGWALRAEKNWYAKPTTCQHCGGSTVAPRVYRRYDYATNQYVTHSDPGDMTNQGSFVFVKRGRKYVEPLKMIFVCADCAPVVSP